MITDMLKLFAFCRSLFLEHEAIEYINSNNSRERAYFGKIVLAARDSPHVDSVRVSGKRFEILFHATQLRGRVNVSFGAAAAATRLVVVAVVAVVVVVVVAVMVVVVHDDQDRSLVPGTGVYRDVMLRHRSRSGRRREPLRCRCASRRSLRLFARALSQNARTAPVCRFGRSGVSAILLLSATSRVGIWNRRLLRIELARALMAQISWEERINWNKTVPRPDFPVSTPLLKRTPESICKRYGHATHLRNQHPGGKDDNV